MQLQIAKDGICGTEQVHDLMASGSYPSEGWVGHVPFDGLADALDELRRGARMKLLVDLPA